MIGQLRKMPWITPIVVAAIMVAAVVTVVLSPLALLVYAGEKITGKPAPWKRNRPETPKHSIRWGGC